MSSIASLNEQISTLRSLAKILAENKTVSDVLINAVVTIENYKQEQLRNDFLNEKVR